MLGAGCGAVIRRRSRARRDHRRGFLGGRGGSAAPAVGRLTPSDNDVDPGARAPIAMRSRTLLDNPPAEAPSRVSPLDAAEAAVSRLKHPLRLTEGATAQVGNRAPRPVW